MKFGKIAACLAATSLVAAPALAQSQANAKPVAAKVERVSAKSESASKLEGGNNALLGILVSAAVIGGFFLLAESSDPSPSSP